MTEFAPQIVVAGLVAVFLIAFCKGAFGGGLAVVGIPVLALVMDPVDAAVVLAPLLPLMDIATLKVFPPRTWSIPDVTWVAGGVFSGMIAGALLFAGLPRDVTGALIGAAILIFALRYLIVRSQPGPPLGVSPPRGFFWGTLGGFATFLANAGQPPVAIYLMRRQLTKTTYAGTMSAIFMIANITRLPLLAGLAFARPHLLLYSAALVPVIPVGAYLGKLLHDRLDRERLFSFVYLMLVIAGAKLLGSSLGLIP
ncbi:sulfite exporter TauE/SafE family protein [Aquabacter sp. CN5-332]|uniref:sulfite exporter TauE/SafE family protein n=1 Tax=Aquabacter sp. CN5-332 TaxID=3156608 RepID=UPI0032B4A87E